MGLFDGKKGLILGVANDHSIAWAIAREIMAGGGVCGFSHLPDRPDDERQRNRRRVALLTDPEPSAKFLVPMDVGQGRRYSGGRRAGEDRIRPDSTSCSIRSPSPRWTI